MGCDIGVGQGGVVVQDVPLVAAVCFNRYVSIRSNGGFTIGVTPHTDMVKSREEYMYDYLPSYYGELTRMKCVQCGVGHWSLGRISLCTWCEYHPIGGRARHGIKIREASPLPSQAREDETYTRLS